MRIFFQFFFFILFICSALGQDTHKGLIVDKTTKQPLPFVNIGVVGKGMGTVSDEQGLFYLYLNDTKILSTDIIQISSLGYQTIEISVANAKFVWNKNSTIEMPPANIILNEVVVSDKELVPIVESIGYRSNGNGYLGYWKDDDALGGELATRIVANKVSRKLKSIEFEVLNNNSDSLLLRANIYDVNYNRDEPGKNLNTSTKNILHTLLRNELLVKIDLEPYEIYIENDFYVSLELVKRFGNEPFALALAASDGNSGSFRRYASQGKWEKVSDVNMAFYVETTYLVSQEKARKYETKIEKAKLKKRTVSGFTISGGKMISNVAVYNKRTKEVTSSDHSGRYTIHAIKNDILIFSKSRYKKVLVEIGKQQFANAILQLE
ncbi:carboxypeptidase-like regulatory domain-containing protein [uncultured Maribacter sp.]|uniref:carboxypeptidase-like regulatory domain-containing protein n=1 Tax=uncultured Maribacter sp. TaxID=431308 RepID=UPI0026195B00|nr:carboxypeptidase-like regulatory domain-containing protein [uncultured Maribacter sp.]